MTSNPLNTETVVIDGKTYTFRTTITNTNNGDVLIAGTAEASMENLIASINLDDGNGFNYSDDTTLHATYSALKTTATTMTVTAKTHGIGANGDVMTETIVTGGSWGGNATGGLDGEETAVLIAQVSGNRWSLHQDWVNPAQSGNTYDVSYVLRDFSGNGASLIGKRQDDWSFNQILNVGNGTAFAYVGIFEGSSMETLDNGSTTVADVRVRTNARLDAGVIFGTFEDGTPVSSGYIINTAGGGSGTDGRMGIDLDAGADTHFNGFFHTSVQQTLHDMQGTGAGIHKWKDFKVFKGMRSTRWLDNVDIVDGLFEGFSNTLDTITLSANIGNFNGITLARTNGFTAVADTAGLPTTIPTIRKYISVNNLRDLQLLEGNFFTFVDATMTKNSTTILTVANQEVSQVTFKVSVKATVKDTAGLPIPAVQCYIYEGTDTRSVPTDSFKITNSSGIAESDVETNKIYNATAFVDIARGDFAIKFYKYGYKAVTLPFDETIISQEVAVGMVKDVELTEAFDRPQAITDGGAIALIEGETEALGVAVVATVPANATTLTIGSRVYTFNTTPAGANSIDIRGTTALQADAIVEAINGDRTTSRPADGYHPATTRHADIRAEIGGTTSTINLFAKARGTGGNGTTLSQSSTHFTLTAFTGTAFNSHSTISYTAGTGTLDVGNVVNGGTSGASGEVVEIVTGDSVAGTVLLKNRDAENFTGTEALTETGASTDWSATLTVSTEQRYKWIIDCVTKNLNLVYDFISAKLAQPTPDADWQQIISWGEDEHAQPLNKSGSTYNTPRNIARTEGVFLANFGAGTVDFFTADDGTTFVPPATVSLTIHVERKDNGTNISGASVIILKTSDNSIIAQGTTDVSGNFGTNYVYTGDVGVTIRCRKSTLPIPRYFNEEAVNTISNTGMNQNFAMRQDFIATQI